MKTELKVILEKMDKSDLIAFISHLMRNINSDSFFKNVEKYIPYFYDEDMFQSMDFRLLVFLSIPENRHLLEHFDNSTYLENKTLSEILNEEDLKKYVSGGDIVFEEENK